MAVPKLSLEQWAKVRSHGEMDPRDGFAWIVKELGLPVSAPGVRKAAVKESWAKCNAAGEATKKPVITTAAAKPEKKKPEKKERNQKPAEEAKPETSNETEIAPYKTRETPLLDELDREQPQQGVFVREYVKDLNGTQAAIRAGYSKETAQEQSSRLLSKAIIQDCVRELRDELLSRLEANAEDVLRVLVNQLHADINEISQYRRVCCHHCWGEVAEDGYRRAYQFSPAEYDKALIRHTKERAKILEQSDQALDIGDFQSQENDWYDKRREPNPECPECFGEGIGEMYLGDTRKLSKAAMAMYGGVKKTKDGIEIIIANREKVIDQLARTLGMFKDKETTVNVTVMSPENLTALFWDRLNGARERQRKVNEERGNIIDVEPTAGDEA